MWRTVPVRSESLPPRVARCFRAIDSMDADAMASFFAAGAAVRLPGVSPIIGATAISKAFVQFCLEVDELHHDPVLLWIAGDLSVLEADVKVTLTDHTMIAFPATYTIRWAGSLIQEAGLDIYMESRVAVAMSAFDRLRSAGRETRRLA